MDKETIYEDFFEAVRNSTEWGLYTDGTKYSQYICGLVDITNSLLERLNEQKNK